MNRTQGCIQDSNFWPTGELQGKQILETKTAASAAVLFLAVGPDYVVDWRWPSGQLDTGSLARTGGVHGRITPHSDDPVDHVS